MGRAETLYFGSLVQEGRSGHRNPVVKLILLLFPLLFVTYQQVGRALGFARLDLPSVLLLALALYWATILNFGTRELSRTILHGLVGGTFLGGLFFMVSRPESTLAGLLGVFVTLYGAIPVLGRVAAESWLYLAFFVIAILAVRNFTSRDAVWIGRRLLGWTQTLYIPYVVVVVTFCVIHSALPLRIGLSWNVASDKCAQLKNPYRSVRKRWWSRTGARWRIFAVTVIGNNTSIAQAVQLLSEQRGMLSTGDVDIIGEQVAGEDVAALALMVLAVAGIVVLGGSL